jgi:hypothetical protein
VVDAQLRFDCIYEGRDEKCESGYEQGFIVLLESFEALRIDTSVGEA